MREEEHGASGNRVSRPNAPLYSSALGCWRILIFPRYTLYCFINPLTRSSQRRQMRCKFTPSAALPERIAFFPGINTLPNLWIFQRSSVYVFMRREVNVFVDKFFVFTYSIYIDFTRFYSLNAIAEKFCSPDHRTIYFKSPENYHHVRKIKREFVVGANQFTESFYWCFYRKRQMKIELAVKFTRRQMDPRAMLYIYSHQICRTFMDAYLDLYNLYWLSSSYVPWNPENPQMCEKRKRVIKFNYDIN